MRPDSFARSRGASGNTVEASLPLLRAELSSTGVRIEVHVDGDVAVGARPSEIEQIVTNLVTNAAHASMESLGPVVTINVVRATAPTSGQESDPGSTGPDQVVLSVHDNGGGIEPQNLDRIFEPFFTTKSASGGTGLGLASVRGIAESLGGHAEVASTVGQGTTFTVVIPSAPSARSGHASPMRQRS